MALKSTIHEKCDRCGKRAATLRGNTIMDYHVCTNAPPGPGPLDYARSWNLGEVNFVRGDWSADELAAELDEANARIGALLDERLKYYSIVQSVVEAVPSELAPLA